MYGQKITDIAKHQEMNLRKAIGDDIYEWLETLTKKEEEKMRQTMITRCFSFEAAHQLPNHKGKCANLHGHSYKLEITVARKGEDIDDERCMVIDFGDLKKYNIGGAPRTKFLSNLSQNEVVSKVPILSEFIKRGVNMKRGKFPPIKPDTKNRLKEHFEPYNKELEEFTGLNLDIWDSL